VPRLLALAEIVRNPEDFDITLPAVPMVPVFDQLSLEAAVDLQLLADWSQTSIDDLRTLNPCLRRFHTPVDGSVVAVPVGTSERILAELADLPRSEWAQMREYTVKSGDTLSGIALRFDMTVAELKKLNKLKSNLIRINQVLAVTFGNAQDIPEGGNLHSVRAGESLSVIAQRYGVSVRSLREANDLGRYLQIGEQLVIPGR
jgi:membrane-bound lytic murein transglycosylase D